MGTQAAPTAVLTVILVLIYMWKIAQHESDHQSEIHTTWQNFCRFLPCLQNLSCFSMMMTICPISLLNGHRIASFRLIPKVYVVLLVLSCSITCAPWSVFQSQTIPGIPRKLPLQKLRSFSWGNFYITVFSLLFLIL